MYKYYDIGLNLFTPSFPNPKQIIKDAENANICFILTGAQPDDNERVNTFVQSQNVYGTAGIHPHVASQATTADILRIEEIVKNNPKIVAVGECGLDYNRMFSLKEIQISVFKSLIKLAEKLNKPLFLHQRDAEEDFIACFKGHEAICKKAVVHCFTGNREMALKLIDMGFYIGITGWICDERRGDDLRKAVSAIPLNRIMIETDAPYLTPRGFNLPRTNIPQNITYVAKSLAAYMNIPEESLLMHARENTKRFFSI